VEARHATAESDNCLRTRSTEEEKTEYRGTHDEKTTKMAMIRATIEGGQAVVLPPWKEFNWNNNFAFNWRHAKRSHRHQGGLVTAKVSAESMIQEGFVAEFLILFLEAIAVLTTRLFRTRLNLIS
jgi:hypothetical protein